MCSSTSTLEFPLSTFEPSSQQEDNNNNTSSTMKSLTPEVTVAEGSSSSSLREMAQDILTPTNEKPLEDMGDNSYSSCSSSNIYDDSESTVDDDKVASLLKTLDEVHAMRTGLRVRRIHGLKRSSSNEEYCSSISWLRHSPRQPATYQSRKLNRSRSADGSIPSQELPKTPLQPQQRRRVGGRRRPRPAPGSKTPPELIALSPPRASRPTKDERALQKRLTRCLSTPVMIVSTTPLRSPRNERGGSKFRQSYPPPRVSSNLDDTNEEQQKFDWAEYAAQNQQKEGMDDSITIAKKMECSSSNHTVSTASMSQSEDFFDWSCHSIDTSCMLHEEEDEDGSSSSLTASDLELARRRSSSSRSSKKLHNSSPSFNAISEADANEEEEDQKRDSFDWKQWATDNRKALSSSGRIRRPKRLSAPSAHQGMQLLKDHNDLGLLDESSSLSKSEGNFLFAARREGLKRGVGSPSRRTRKCTS